MDKLVIIDGNSLINRAFYALPMLSNSRGEFSNGVYGFTNILIKTILEVKPKYIVVALDYGKKTFRNKIYGDYKANRKQTPDELKSQFPILRELLKTMGIAYIEKENYEADDLIGTLSRKFDTKNIIITGDKDALQLINENTDVWLTKKGITEVKEMTPETLKNEMGLLPYQIIELKSLMGDSSDNIPGVKGIGEKTALNLLNTYQDLDNIYRNLDEIKGKIHENLVNFKDDAYMSKTLATINVNVDIELNLSDLEYKFPFDKSVYEFFKNYEFNSLIKKEDLFENVIEFETKSKLNANKIEISSYDDIEKQIKHIKNSGEFAFELNNEFFCFAYDKNCEFFCKTQPSLIDDNLDIDKVLIKLKDIFEDEKISKIVYDKKKAYYALKTFEIKPKNMAFDCLLAYYLAYCGERDCNIENMYSTFNLDKNFLAVNLFYFKEQLQKKLIDFKLENLYQNIEDPLVDVLYQMENNGFKLDYDALIEMYNHYFQEIQNLSTEIKSMAGIEFNINSPKQLAEVLFDRLGLVCYNNKKRSTSIEFLDEMYDLHPIVPNIIRYRKIQKIFNGYIEAYKNIVTQDNTIIHTIFNQTLTNTGRLSSSEPNLQNIPARDEEGKNLRKLFVSSFEDGALVSADYSQIELRLLAHMSNDPSLIQAFVDGVDIHSKTASEVFDVDIQDVTPNMRRTAKAVNFGIIYGISDYGLSQNINTSRKQAKLYIDQYFKKYPNVKEYMDKSIESAKETGYAISLFGRRRKINELASPNFMTRQFGERVAMNMPLQGTASDIIKLAMIKVFNALRENNLKSKLILQIHDELIVDCPRDEIEIVAKILRANMENVVKLSVPLTVDVNSGKTLFDC